MAGRNGMATTASSREEGDVRKARGVGMTARQAVVLGVVLGASWGAPAHAYVDPGTGSMVVQMLAAAAAASLFFLRSVRAWIVARFRGRAKKEEPGEPKG